VKLPVPKFNWLWRIPLFAFLGVCALLLIFRWLPIPTSAFMLSQNIDALFDSNVPFVRHEWTPMERIPYSMRLAVIASEDQNFPVHWGVDVEATKAAIAAELHGQKTGGGSTLTQQVAKNLFLWQGRSYARKGLEWWLAGLIEVFWPKERILEVYLNIAQFSKADYGVGAASANLFRKPVERINSNDAALLAAVLPAPSQFSAVKPSKYIRARQRYVLRQMRYLGGRNYLATLQQPD